MQILVEKGIPAFAMQSGLSTDDFGWGSATFHKMVRVVCECVCPCLCLCMRVCVCVCL